MFEILFFCAEPFYCTTQIGDGRVLFSKIIVDGQLFSHRTVVCRILTASFELSLILVSGVF